MSIADDTRTILLLEAFADEARRLASERRAALTVRARKQLETEKIAPAWHLPQVAKVTLGVTKAAAFIADAAKFAAWVAARFPDQMEQTIRPAFSDQLLKSLALEGESAVHLETGEIVPGIAVRKGGQPANLSVKPEPGIKHELAATVARMLATAHPEIVATDKALPAPNDPWIPSGDPFAAFPAGGAV